MASPDEMFLPGPASTSLPPANVVFLMQENNTSRPLEWWAPRNLKFRKRPEGPYMSPLSLLVSHWTLSSRVS